MYNVFCDFHHAGLLNSLILLFEKRLGGNLYRPIGLEWYQEGYWHIYPHPATAEQYLGLRDGYRPPDGTPPLNQLASSINDFNIDIPGVYACKDIVGEGYNKAITLEAFKQIKMDFVIASIPQHIEPFRKLIDLYQPQAKLIYQIGNAWNITPEQGAMLDGIMASAKVGFPGTVLGHNGQPLHLIEYHQEFNTQVFNYRTPAPTSKKIYSFVNVLQEKPQDWELFLALEKLMPDWEFKSFGGQCRDGVVQGDWAMADKMTEATFGFHCKTGGDGYGHVIHNWAAIGRPLIIRQSDYAGKLAEPLITPNTAVIVDGKTPEQIAEEIRAFNSTFGGREISSWFETLVDFDKEEQQIREFLDSV